MIEALRISICTVECSNEISLQICHHCLVNELQRFPVLRKRMDEVIGNFLRDGLEPSETMIGHIIEMEVCSYLYFSKSYWLSFLVNNALYLRSPFNPCVFILLTCFLLYLY